MESDHPPLSGTSPQQQGVTFHTHILRPGRSWQWGDPKGLEHTRITLRIPGLPPATSGFKLFHLSDLHFRARRHPAVSELISTVNAAQPDAIAITGDFVEDKQHPQPAIPHLREFLTSLQSKHGTFGILGNHDQRHLLPLVQDMPLTMLDHARAVIGPPLSPARQIELIGLCGADRTHLDQAFLGSLPQPTPSVPRIVLCHYPDLALRVAPMLHPLLYLTGHTHGGQVRLPTSRALMSHDSLPKHFASGFHPLSSLPTPATSPSPSSPPSPPSGYIHISRGWGFSSLPVRLFCPPQVCEFVFEPQV